MKNQKYLESVHQENITKSNELIKIFKLTVEMEDKLLEHVKQIEENNLKLQESLTFILNDFKTITANLCPHN